MKPSNALVKARPSKPLSNPTSTGTTLAEFAVLLYLALEYIFTTDPGHVRYREDKEKGGSRSKVMDRGPAVGKGEERERGGGRGSSTQRIHHSANSRPSPHVLPHHGVPNGTRGASGSLNPAGLTDLPISKAAMSEAWSRMRGVEPLVYGKGIMKGQGAKAKQKVGRHVQWGSVRTYGAQRGDGERGGVGG
ncbi:hypothetical protein IQ07DRAFT_100944 [Pyrenochaeta sp. DS3sAY3a]|nr:hypothetical protein IQ07DRAFT_100944 [Pyrenochaeta sp. DS3sAY3a]